MRTYAEYLNSLTVKTLNVIAKTLSLRGYSRLRKAELVEVIARQIGMDETAAYAEIAPVKILSVEVEADHAQIAEILDEAFPPSIATLDNDYRATLTFSHTPAKAPQSEPKTVSAPVPTNTPNDYARESTEDLIEAYQSMRATLHRSRGLSHNKIAAKLRLISTVLKRRKVNLRTV